MHYSDENKIRGYSILDTHCRDNSSCSVVIPWFSSRDKCINSNRDIHSNLRITYLEKIFTMDKNTAVSFIRLKNDMNKDFTQIKNLIKEKWK